MAVPEYNRWNWRKYVRRLGYRNNLKHYQWWNSKFSSMQIALRYRYEAIKMGSDPGPPEQLLKAIWTRELRPEWTIALLRIVSQVDRRARREINAANHSNKEDR